MAHERAVLALVFLGSFIPEKEKDEKNYRKTEELWKLMKFFNCSHNFSGVDVTFRKEHLLSEELFLLCTLGHIQIKCQRCRGVSPLRIFSAVMGAEDKTLITPFRQPQFQLENLPPPGSHLSRAWALAPPARVL